ncbi:hypothetical protein AKJ51_00205 [candidate division MSBL1 archaeon SCGC-AAA382A20]|uniref:Uncharacterized protein n=1 Tax=candidate division MSBL1 archaeon SCGC-AAA382A20 TaxID=1698280 RepID=A0A133VMT8_9EURY|nr:hypothetical protein AKJ51_00205 [candidate division MSBL1 archaeon SCGC-AAA382A20]
MLRSIGELETFRDLIDEEGLDGLMETIVEVNPERERKRDQRERRKTSSRFEPWFWLPSADSDLKPPAIGGSSTLHHSILHPNPPVSGTSPILSTSP